MPFLLPNQHCKSLWGKIITFHGLAYPELTGGVFQLCLWPLIAPGYLGGGLPLISPLMLVLLAFAWHQKLSVIILICNITLKLGIVPLKRCMFLCGRCWALHHSTPCWLTAGWLIRSWKQFIASGTCHTSTTPYQSLVFCSDNLLDLCVVHSHVVIDRQVTSYLVSRWLLSTEFIPV